MRNKGFFWTITIALIAATIYQLSFTMATKSVESEAIIVAGEKIDSLTTNNIDFIISRGDTLYTDTVKHQKEITNFFAAAYVRSVANESAHFTGATYADCQKKEINLGLDLQGGMSVTLEISVPELVENLAGNTKKSTFYVPYAEAVRLNKEGKGDFIELFAEEFEKNEPEAKMAKIFHRHNQDEVAPNATNDEVIEFLQLKASSALDGVETIIEKRVNQFGVAQPTIQQQKASSRITVELPGVKDRGSVRRKLQATANLEFFETYPGAGGFIGQYEPALSKALFGNVIGENDSLENPSELKLNMDAKPDTAAVPDNELKEPTLTLDGDSVDSTEINDTAETTPQDSLTIDQQRKLNPIQAYLYLYLEYGEDGTTPVGYNNGARVGRAQVIDTSLLNSRLNHPSFKELLPDDLVFMWSAKEIINADGNKTGIIDLYSIKVLREGAPVNGEDIANSSSRFDPSSGHTVVMNMTPMGSAKWADLTKKNLKRQVAITMDNYVFSAPVVQSEMSNNATITGGFTMEEAKDLSGLLNAGSLPAPAKIVDETSVGPTLGADNINSGMWSFLFAILLVLVYMIFYYGKAGIIADIALVVNIFLLVGALSSLHAILTLPGIAGIVLTIGMSVDANVLIFERIREELRGGKGTRAAIEEGFNKAMAAILDANITTLLTGIVLVIFGSGPIKGFATTLIIGIFTSFFAAVVVSRLVFSLMTEKGIEFKFSTSVTKNWFINSNISFVTNRKKFYVLSAIIISIGLGALFTRGLDKGVDFTGGRTYTVEFGQDIDINDLASSLEVPFESKPIVKTVGNSYTAAITTKYLITDGSDSINNVVESRLKNGLLQYGEIEITSTKMIAPTISRDLKYNSFLAVIFALVIIFLYILFRFRKWQYGLGALLAMAHDVLIVLGLFAIFWGWIGFSMEIDQAFIAAILTVVGYSINDTVVVFDRIREYLRIHPQRDRKDVINSALNSTMSRTINTSVSTFIVLLIIFLFGGESIKGFTFALMIGVIVGTYSSLFIATPAVVDLEKDKKEKK
jgi:SecD/SecF fusion protein